MFIDDAHILRASSSTVCAWTSKRPAIARISCGSVIKRVAMLPLLLLDEFLELDMGRPSQLAATRHESRWRETPSLSAGCWRSRYHAGSPRHVEARFRFGLPLAPFGPFVPLVHALCGGLVGRLVAGIGALFRLRCPVVIIIRRNRHPPLQGNR